MLNSIIRYDRASACNSSHLVAATGVFAGLAIEWQVEVCITRLGWRGCQSFGINFMLWRDSSLVRPQKSQQSCVCQHQRLNISGWSTTTQQATRWRGTGVVGGVGQILDQKSRTVSISITLKSTFPYPSPHSFLWSKETHDTTDKMLGMGDDSTVLVYIRSWRWQLIILACLLWSRGGIDHSSIREQININSLKCLITAHQTV